MNKIKYYATIAALVSSISLSGCSIVSEDKSVIIEDFEISELHTLEKIEEISRVTQEKAARKDRENFNNFIGDETILDNPDFTNMDQILITYNNKLGRYELTCYCENNTYNLYFGQNDIYLMGYLFTQINCNTVYLNDIDDKNILGAVSRSKSIKALSIQLSDIDSLDEIAFMTSLELLNIENCPNITDISALNKLINLKTLSIMGTKIKDVSPLANLKNLNVLQLRCNEITNPETLATLDNLTSISLDYNKIEDDKQLNSFIKKGLLSEDTASYIVRSTTDNNLLFYISDNLEEASFLKITYIDAQDKYYIELRDENRNILCYTLVDDTYGAHAITKDLKNCKNLSISNCNNKEVTRHIFNKKDIEYLSIFGCSFESLYFISDFSNLLYLEIDNCPDITYEFEKNEMYGTYQLKKLKTIIVRDTGISNLDAFSRNKTLEYVESKYNNVSDYNFLTCLPNLQIADLSTDIDFIDYKSFNTLLDNSVTLRINGQIVTKEVLKQDEEQVKEYKLVD